MPRRKAPEELTEEELRRLLIEKRRGARRDRIEHFRQTGRVVAVTADLAADSVRGGEPVQSAEAREAEPPEVPAKRRFADRILLSVEVLAVLALVGMMIVGVVTFNDFNREALASFNETPAPTPLVMAVVLPSGHTPPDAQGNTRPNEAEIPEHLRPMVQSLGNIAVPTAGPEQAIRVSIPALNVNSPIVQGDGWEQLKKGVGQHIGSGNPGQTGNVVLSAHNDVYGQLFRFLDKLAPGDLVILYTMQRQYIYVVTGTLVVEPTQVEVMAPTPDPTVTLISCYPYMINKQRIVVFAKLQN